MTSISSDDSPSAVPGPNLSDLALLGAWTASGSSSQEPMATRMASIGAGRPVHSSSWIAAWCSSIGNPLTVFAPEASAASSNTVRNG